jgi:hypothetical protein
MTQIHLIAAGDLQLAFYSVSLLVSVLPEVLLLIDVVLDRKVHRRYRGGASPSEEIFRAITRDTSGVARIYLADGRVDIIVV